MGRHPGSDGRGEGLTTGKCVGQGQAGGEDALNCWQIHSCCAVVSRGCSCFLLVSGVIAAESNGVQDDKLRKNE